MAVLLGASAFAADVQLTARKPTLGAFHQLVSQIDAAQEELNNRDIIISESARLRLLRLRQNLDKAIRVVDRQGIVTHADMNAAQRTLKAFRAIYTAQQTSQEQGQQEERKEASAVTMASPTPKRSTKQQTLSRGALVRTRDLKHAELARREKSKHAPSDPQIQKLKKEILQLNATIEPIHQQALSHKTHPITPSASREQIMRDYLIGIRSEQVSNTNLGPLIGLMAEYARSLWLDETVSTDTAIILHDAVLDDDGGIKYYDSFADISTEICVAISPDGNFIVTGSGESNQDHAPTVMVWAEDRPFLNRRLIHTLDHEHPILAIAVNKNFIVTLSGKKIRIWNLQTGALVREIKPQYAINAIAIHPDKNTLYTGSTFTNKIGLEATIQLWNLDTGNLIRTFDYTDSVDQIAISSNGSHIVTVANDIVQIFDAHTGGLIFTVPNSKGTPYSVAISSDGNLVVMGFEDGTAQVWNIPEGTLQLTLESGYWPIRSLAISADKSFIVSADADGLLVWNAQTGRLTRHDLPGRSIRGEISSVAISPDERFIVTGGFKGIARIWASKP